MDAASNPNEAKALAGRRPAGASVASEAVGEANRFFSWVFCSHYIDTTERKIVPIHKIFPLSQRTIKQPF